MRRETGSPGSSAPSTARPFASKRVGDGAKGLAAGGEEQARPWAIGQQSGEGGRDDCACITAVALHRHGHEAGAAEPQARGHVAMAGAIRAEGDMREWSLQNLRARHRVIRADKAEHRTFQQEFDTRLGLCLSRQCRG